ncbi:16S rRNA (guanine(966)-N(2))-methyltransferase RsmD [Bifidobacterium jacchi]|uniref:16S rRNA (Guanine(966)-N(2))-methyltransferase RsmD n=1 Tax=Bifidobacterium jacchi TaxID=2490545 RepID=A0A5N5RHW6_9BIFI|nr:16S rRNA (guanine(966)-N(2))-methyltransferase RsmD [Bifidobacterium jacchi]KAB5606361.1 16S rRNA (guanine(966)-N(2))-methyltransferase RsmD [Bifidobacterium jacchi]
MHVISGRFKGAPLASPNANTRPTTDRTKEAIFSRLDAWDVIADARVLDLYAGTGALGIEALSRGARELVCVESDGRTATLIAKTLTTLKHGRAWAAAPGITARVIRAKAERYAAAGSGPFDLILIDPPYALSTDDCDRLLADLASSGTAADDALIVLERSVRSEEPSAPAGWVIGERRDYGETAVYYIERDARSDSERDGELGE